jgi:Fe-S-cluster containining protein
VTTQSTVASRSTAFGYVCRRCSRCCRDKHIQVNPYEVARLARAKGQSGSEFRAAWTVDNQGTALRRNEDGTCVFLGPQGCDVHSDRPLVCRLYPLGRHVRSDGTEYFSQLEGHPQSAGEFTDRGTIAEYLAAQDAQPFMDAADAYFRWLCAARERLALVSDHTAVQAGAEETDLLDMDAMVARHCQAAGEAEPSNVDEGKRLHLQLLHDAIANLDDGQTEEESSNAFVARLAGSIDVCAQGRSKRREQRE